MGVRSNTQSGAQSYEIRVEGHIDSLYSEWFDDLILTYEADGTTVLDGPVSDQAALHGILAKVRDLGLPLLSVNRVECQQGVRC